MKKPAINKDQHAKSAGTLHIPVLPGLPEQIRLLVNVACAAHGGIGCMSLNDWRDVEQQLKRRFKDEQ
jgi:hypothetical protein